MTVNSAMVVSSIKWVTKFCMNRTVSSSIKTIAAASHAQVVPFVEERGVANTLARTIGAEAVSLVVTSATSKIVDKTIDEMESRWYDPKHQLTEAEKMLEDYNNGLTVLNNQSLAYADTGGFDFLMGGTT